METYWIILLVANLPVYIGLGWLIFDSWEGFFEAIKFWLKPDLFSMFDGSYWDDVGAEFKLFGWVAMCAVMVAAEHWALQKWVFTGTP